MALLNVSSARSLIFASSLATTTLLAAQGCSSDAGPPENQETSWSDLTAEDDDGAVIEDADALLTDDLTTDAAIDDDDPLSADDDDDLTSEPGGIADVAADLVPGEASEPTLLPNDLSAATHYHNAVLGNCADPGVLRVGGASPTFYVACTGGGYPRFSSDDLVHWKGAGHIFSGATRPRWASANFWAPEIHPVGGRSMAYFAALSGKRGKMCIGAARSDSPGGKFQDIGHPLACSRHVGLIDPHVLTDKRGRHFLYYKTDSNALRPQELTTIYGQELDDSGVRFIGKRKALLRNRRAWEGDVVEAPWVHERNGRFYMFYSGFRFCNPTYAVGVARADSPLGTFKRRGLPILRSNTQWTAPGHNSIVSTGGHDYIVYHAYKHGHQCGDDGARELLVDRVRWVGGWPRINNGTPSRGSMPVPVVP